MTLPDIDALNTALEATWPPLSTWQVDSFTFRDGAGGGKRVSAASAPAKVHEDDLARAESALIKAQLPRLFRLSEGEKVFDAVLEKCGYRVVDPTRYYAATVKTLLRPDQPPLDAVASETRLAIQDEIWASAGIRPARLAVMQRAETPRAWLLARRGDRAVGTGFVSVHDRIAMIHALEVRMNSRRQGAARAMIHRAAKWAAERDASYIGLAVVAANKPANTLYASLGMAVVGQYHYRLHPDDTP